MKGSATQSLSPRSISRRLIAAGFVGASLLFGTGCGGGGSSNDGGIVFTLLGFYPADSATSGGCDSPPTAGLAGLIIPLADSGATEGATEAFGGGVFTIGVQNNIVTTYMQTTSVFLSYRIAGQSNSNVIPSTTYPVSIILGPGDTAVEEDDAGGAPPSSLPGNFDNLCQRSFFEVVGFPTPVRQWMLLNQDKLPELPFTVIVSVTVEGQSGSGKSYRTQPMELFAEVVSNVGIPGTQGSGGNTGGGDDIGTGGGTGTVEEGFDDSGSGETLF